MCRSLALALFIFCIGLLPTYAQDDEPLNLVFILADDFGWSDTSLYGMTSFYETPNIQRLADRGILFTNAYTAHPLCSPTRSSIMTGLDPGRTGFTSAAGHLQQVNLEKRLDKRTLPGRKVYTPISISRLDTSYTTLAETIQSAGYVTGHFGKWHLGREPYSPLQHGFDVDVPHWPGPGPAGSYVAPWKFPPALDFDPAVSDEHIEDRMADEAVAFIEQHKDEPFFLNYWAFSVHAPFDGKQSLIKKYEQKADPQDPQRCPVYGAMVESLDDAVGRLLDTLDRLQLSEKTIVVFFSDNGGNMYSRVDGIPPTSNAPLRGGKATIYEGGTRVPCAVIWPGKTKAGSRTDEFLTSTDWYPTLLEMLSIDKPSDIQFDGFSQVPAILGNDSPRESIVCFVPNYYPKPETIPSTYIRQGDWKLIRYHGAGANGSDRLELYNLQDDLGETTDVAQAHPELVQELNDGISSHLAHIEAVVPKPIAQTNLDRQPARRTTAPTRPQPPKGVSRTADSRANIILIYTDDHGYADLSAQGILDDIQTPHTDRLAANGVQFTAGYCSAPQCRPSRAGLLTGRYQNLFGLEQNGDAALPWSENTIAERLASVGYITGMCGKWHLDGSVGSNGEHPDGTPGERVVNKAGQYKGPPLENPGHAGHHGFQEYLCGPTRTYIATHDAAGHDLEGTTVHVDRRFRIDVQAEWAASFIDRHAEKESPFFLYVPFFAPHVPLESPQKYLDRFPSKMPRRRRLALAMISAVDDGVGLISRTLEDNGIADNTLIFYISDNGAPLKIHKVDAPGGGPGWDGSLNDPWIGEKGMLTEGGIRVPFVASWPSQMPRGMIYERPVIALDATATALAAGGIQVGGELDGVDLLPFLLGEKSGDSHDAIYWKWAGQAAIREGDWKYLIGGGSAYLFDLAHPSHEHRNVIDKQPDVATRLRSKLQTWADTLLVPGLPTSDTVAGSRYFDHYLNGKPATPPGRASADNAGPAAKPSQRNFAALFRQRDKDKDGYLTLQEYIGNPKNRNVPVLTRRFKKLDVDTDERLTLSELQGNP